jgi:hypothetical protein
MWPALMHGPLESDLGPCQTQFPPKQQESNVMPSMILMEGTCDAAIIIVEDPKNLDAWELHQEPAPWNKFHHPIINKAEKQFLRGDKHCRKRAANLHHRL